MTSLTKICLHWTGGANMPCEQNFDCYHFLFDKNGKEYKGKYKPEDNLNCTDGIYAKHCGGGNTGCIGVSCCGMYGFNLQNKKTKYQMEYHENSGSWFYECNFSWSSAFMVAGI